MKRRETLAGLLALCAAPTLLAQTGRKVTVGVLFPFLETDGDTRTRRAIIARELERAGWREGSNLQFEIRYAVGDAALDRAAAELAALKPTVMLVHTNLAMNAVRRQNVTLPMVFAAVSDPVGSGFVASLARPGGNVTGFTNFSPEMGAKWLEVLRELAPRVERAIVLLNSSIAANVEIARSVEAAAATRGMTIVRVASGDAAALEHAIAGLPADGRTGLIAMPNPTNTAQQQQIFAAVGRHRLPAIYPFRYYAVNGGLVAYGIDINEQFRLAAGYLDRILRGAKPGDLPVQQPTKYELFINVSVARTLGLSIPASLLARADEVIE